MVSACEVESTYLDTWVIQYLQVHKNYSAVLVLIDTKLEELLVSWQAQLYR